MPLCSGWLWTLPICPAGAQSLQLPGKRPRSLADFLSQSQIHRVRADNFVRSSSNRNQAQDVLQAGRVANESPPRPRRAPFLFVPALGRSRDTSSRAPVPIRQTPPQSRGRALLLAQRVARPFLCRREVCPDG